MVMRSNREASTCLRVINGIRELTKSGFLDQRAEERDMSLGEKQSEVLEISVVVPMYNEEEVIDELCARLKKVLDGTGKTYEIIFVDDGSTDHTFKALKENQKRGTEIRLIKLRGNFGQTAALAAGFDTAMGEMVIAMDGDLQHLPEDIPKFIVELENGYDIVSGWRADRKDPFLSRRLPSRIANWLMSRMSGIELHDFGTTFKAYKRDIVKEIRLHGELHRFIPVLASRLRARIKEIPIENVRQEHRKSHYNITRTLEVLFDLIRLNFLNKFMEKPLQLFGTMGFLADLVGGIILLYLIYLKYVHGLGLLQHRAPLFIFSLTLIVVGILFIILGLLGEMMVKFFYESTNVKVYSIDSTYGTRSSEQVK